MPTQRNFNSDQYKGAVAPPMGALWGVAPGLYDPPGAISSLPVVTFQPPMSETMRSLDRQSVTLKERSDEGIVKT